MALLFLMFRRSTLITLPAMVTLPDTSLKPLIGTACEAIAEPVIFFPFLGGGGDGA
jgi:hypothetical protein